MKRPCLPFILIVAILLASCTKNEDYADKFVSYDIVQLVSASNTGTTFSLYLPDSDSEIIYNDTRGAVIDTGKVAIGERLFLGYIPASQPYVSGFITATGYTPITNDTLYVNTETPVDSTNWNANGIYIHSIWRMGNFINVHGKLTYTDAGSRLRLAVDKSALDTTPAVTSVYLIYYMEKPVANFEREFYASFNISSVWNSTWCAGIEVNVANTNLTNKNKFYFSK